MSSFAIIFLSLLAISNGTKENCQESDSGKPLKAWKSDSCSKFYKCENGEPKMKSCPSGLYFNNVTNLCDWPNNVTCQITLDEAESFPHISEPSFIYLTFDDGPGGGTNETLDLLHELDVRATFFVVAGNLERNHTESRASFVRSIREGHVIGDHSMDHMGHNDPNGSGNGAYQEDVDNDATYFGKKCIDLAMETMEAAGFSAAERERVSSTMHSFVRMPYSNNWRFANRIRSDCTGCTLPPESAYFGLKLADRLEKDGRNVVGWDYGWPTDYGKNLYTKNALQVMMALSAIRSRQRNKVVILTHDKLHNLVSGENGEYNLQQLKLVVRLAKKMGYEFRTLDTYMTDSSVRIGMCSFSVVSISLVMHFAFPLLVRS